MMNAPKSIWPFSTGPELEAKCQALCESCWGGRGREKGYEGSGGWMERAQPWEKALGNGPREQEDTRYSAICAAKKHKDVLGNTCLCVCARTCVCVCTDGLCTNEAYFVHKWVCSLPRWWRSASSQCNTIHCKSKLNRLFTPEGCTMKQA